MPSLGTIGGHQGAPGPTRKRALAHQAKTDLVADTPRQYQQPGAAKKFYTRRVGTTGEQLVTCRFDDHGRGHAGDQAHVVRKPVDHDPDWDSLRQPYPTEGWIDVSDEVAADSILAVGDRRSHAI